MLLPYGRISCDYIGDVTILSWLYDPSSEDSYQTGHSLSFSVWSESSLPAWRNLRALPIHREISRSFSSKSRGVSLRNVAGVLREHLRSFSAKYRGGNPRWNKWFFFFSRKKLFRARGVARRNAKKELLSCADLYVNQSQSTSLMTSMLRRYIAGYTDAYSWRYPIRRRITFASALELMHYLIYSDILWTFVKNCLTKKGSIGEYLIFQNGDKHCTIGLKK